MRDERKWGAFFFLGVYSYFCHRFPPPLFLLPPSLSSHLSTTPVIQYFTSSQPLMMVWPCLCIADPGQAIRSVNLSFPSREAIIPTAVRIYQSKHRGGVSGVRRRRQLRCKSSIPPVLRAPSPELARIRFRRDALALTLLILDPFSPVYERGLNDR